MIKKIYFILFSLRNLLPCILCTCNFFSYGQSLLQPCGTDEMAVELLMQNPEILPQWTTAYQQQESYIQQFSNNPQPESGPVYIIPVVIHIIHYDGTENISDAQAINGIEILNRNFRKLNPDTNEIVPAFQSIAADMEIEFRLATIDPSGNCTNGINRIRSLTTNTGGHEVKSLVHWPRNKYLNIYVVKNAAGLAGHALMPFQADSLPGIDGIVIAGDYFGNIGTSNDLRSVVLSHEVGHYLNLFHIWGGNNVPGFYYLPVAQASNCNEEDGVSDTPNTIGWQTCNLNGASCGNVQDNVQNFMDYAYCARMFTEGQKQRVHAALQSPIAERNQLWTPQNLDTTGITNNPGLCTANFSAPRQTYCTGENIAFYDASFHGANTWNWDFGDGNTSALQHPVHAYNTPGNYSISLTVSDGNNSLSITKNNYIKILNSTSLNAPYSEGFENAIVFTDTDLFPLPENHSDLSITSQAAFSGLQSSIWENKRYTTDSLHRTVIISPKIDITALSQPTLTFRYAYALQDSHNLADRLIVKFSRNCGQTWIQRLVITDSVLTQVTDLSGNFIPTSNQWKQAILTNFPGSYNSPDFMFSIEWISPGGNPLYIDDINLTSFQQVGIEDFSMNDILIYPNPVENTCHIQSPYPVTSMMAWDATGRMVLQGNHYPSEFSFDTSGWESGIYILVLEINGIRKHHKIMKK